MKPIELAEDDFYDKKDLGIFYYKDVDERFHCRVVLPDKEFLRNIWQNEKLAFDWMDGFKEYFT